MGEIHTSSLNFELLFGLFLSFIILAMIYNSKVMFCFILAILIISISLEARVVTLFLRRNLPKRQSLLSEKK